MLRFKKIEMENFGTYKGLKEFDFTNQDGVTIVWGNNGLGKTTLLNAFKYVLFNKIVGRGNEITLKRQLINWDSYEKGEYSFKVSLHFSMEQNEYILTRKYFLASPDFDPTNDKNYKEEVQLFENGTILSSEGCQHIINTVMPEQVSRFFLFDGELLKEYEELLHEEKIVGQKIKQAIEEILGVPILTNSLTDVSSVTSDYENSLTKAAQKNAEHKILGDTLERQQVKLDTLKKDLVKLEDEYNSNQIILHDLEASRAKNERIKEIIEEIARWEAVKLKCETDIDEKRLRICEFSSDAWRCALGSTVRSILDNLSTEKNVLEGKREQYERSRQILDTLKNTLLKGACEICKHTLTDAAVEEIKNKILALESENRPLTIEENCRLETIKVQISELGHVFKTDVRMAIEVLEEEISDLTVDRADAIQKIKELKADIDNYAAQKKEIEEITQNIYTTSLVLRNLEDGIRSLKQEVDELEESIKKAKQKLVSGSSSDMEYSILQQKSRFCADLRDLIDESLDTYRIFLKEQVQEDATKIFLNLTNDPSYASLQINENYGLNIVHEGGKVVTIRSAGFEHVVALSLIGALHQNAPLQGPIIMDSPFGRLDSVHEKNILSYLPKLSSQVMLFVFDKEINEQLARELLGSDLLQEFELSRGESFETIIRRK